MRLTWGRGSESFSDLYRHPAPVVVSLYFRTRACVFVRIERRVLSVTTWRGFPNSKNINVCVWSTFMEIQCVYVAVVVGKCSR